MTEGSVAVSVTKPRPDVRLVTLHRPAQLKAITLR